MSDVPGWWSSSWISYSQDPREDLGVFVFRRGFVITHLPRALPIRVSADQRYQLYVNGQLVGEGPARGDLQHWAYESFDIAPWLDTGVNEVRAVVWNFGRYGPMAQISARLGFLLDGPDWQTPGGWEAARLDGRNFDMLHSSVESVYIDVGPGESWNGIHSCDPLRDDLIWIAPNVICRAETRGASGGGTPWMLVPRSIPAMRREASGPVGKIVDRKTGERRDWQACRVVSGETLLLDRGHLVVGTPKLVLSGHGLVFVTYAEALMDEKGHKGHRDDVTGKFCRGVCDRVIFVGDLTFEPAWWRTWRYIELTVSGDVTIHSATYESTGYPYDVEASFECDDEEVNRIWEVAVRTAELCAGETFFDCPYYEQLQYAGDTRIQAQIMRALTRDRRLVDQAIEQFAWSITPDGLTQSRYPSRQMQVIPPFSLWWVLMMGDAWWMDHAELSAERRRQVEGVLAAFRERADGPESGHGWTFADWVPGWRWGEPPGRLGSMIHELTWRWAADAAQEMGCEVSVPPLADWLKQAARDLDEADVESEHARSLRRILERRAGVTGTPWPANPAEAACTYYFSYYRHQALRPSDYLAELEPWREMIREGLTTFAENPPPVRSDCHAWSAHPILGLIQFVAGVEPIERGQTRLAIRPQIARLRHLRLTMPHPEGEVIVQWDGDQLVVGSPVPFDLEWQGKRESFAPGKHEVG